MLLSIDDQILVYLILRGNVTNEEVAYMSPIMKFCISKCKRVYYGDYPHDVCLACGGKVIKEELEGM